MRKFKLIMNGEMQSIYCGLVICFLKKKEYTDEFEGKEKVKSLYIDW